MRCEQAQRALSDARYASLDRNARGVGEGAGATEVERAQAGSIEHAALTAHLASCAACRALEAQQVALDRALALASDAQPSLDFDATFFARLTQDRARSRRRKVVGIAAALLPIAAAVAIAVLRDRPSTPDPMILSQLPAGDVELAVDLDLVEDLEVVEHLDEIEAYELLGDVDEAELERILRETR
jgi:hypothetical protein